MRTIHTLVQGSDAWHEFRLSHFGASEASAMLGISRKVKRNELLEAKKTGIAREFSAWVQRNILDYGHEVEALARPIAEKIIGTTLYPVTCSMGILSASCDGISLDETIAFEHKQWNAEYGALVASGEVPEEHMPQCQQVLLVTGAEKLLFVVSDGTEDNFASVWVYPDAEYQERIIAGWAQFAKDLEAFEPKQAAPEIIKSEGETLPAVFVQVQGSLAVTNNLTKFGDALQSFLSRINKEPQTDQDFADCEAAIKTLSKAEEALNAAEASALAQVACIDEMRTLKATLHDMARSNRLMLEKLVKSEKENRKQALVRGAQEAWSAHMSGLNALLGKPYMPRIAVDFGGCIKGMSKLSNMQDAIDTKLANAKIEADAMHAKIATNLATLREQASNHTFLFADTASIVLKANDDLVSLIKVRIADHEAAEAQRRETERARIAAEEKAKAERAANEEAARIIEAERAKIQAEERARGEASRPAIAAQVVPQDPPAPIQPAIVEQKAISTAPTLRLGQICERLGFSVTQSFLDSLGFAAAGKERAAVLYHEHQFPAMCSAIARHVAAVSAQHQDRQAA